MRKTHSEEGRLPLTTNYLNHKFHMQYISIGIDATALYISIFIFILCS